MLALLVVEEDMVVALAEFVDLTADVGVNKHVEHMEGVG